MEMEQQKQWTAAQEIKLSIDLVEATKKHLKFLATVDRNRHLYEDPALKLAIHRYNFFWLPLLAKHSENPLSVEPLVVPLDCEWIWHCHRLNPIRYKFDCMKLFGRILGNRNVISSVEGTSKTVTEEIWKKMYPDEPYELDLNRMDVLQEPRQSDKVTSYDLVAAVKRQIPFTYQVSRAHMSDDLFLQEAVARYKGFLHLIRNNRKTNIKRFSVPTFDVDLIWHTHQLHPESYYKDLIEEVGRVLNHDDTDSDKSKGSKLDTGFSDTTQQWEETFGRKYWKAGAMYRGNTPTPVVTEVPVQSDFMGKELVGVENCDKPIQFSAAKSVEVLLEFTEIRNLPEKHKGKILVSFSKKQNDKLFKPKQSLTVFSECGEKQVACFQCEPTGEFLFELMSQSTSGNSKPASLKLLGSCTFSLQELVASRSQLSADKWLSLDPVPGFHSSEPVLLHASVSFTPPTPAPRSFQLVSSKPFLEARVVNGDGNGVCSLQMRNNEVYYIADTGEKHKVAECLGESWFIKGTNVSLNLYNNAGNESNDGPLFELVGDKLVKLFPGRRLDFEHKCCRDEIIEQDFVTAVEFSAENPYGKAVALLNLKTGTAKVIDEWMVLPGITLAFLLSDILTREFCTSFAAENGDKLAMKYGKAMHAAMVTDEFEQETGKRVQGISGRIIAVNSGDSAECVALCSSDCEEKMAACGGVASGDFGLAITRTECAVCDRKMAACGGQTACGDFGLSITGAKCGSKCSGSCKSGGYGNKFKSADCGSACFGGSCNGGGSVVKSSACGSKCSGRCKSGGYGNNFKSADCGSACFSGSCNRGGSVVKSADCGSACFGGNCNGGGSIAKSTFCRYFCSFSEGAADMASGDNGNIAISGDNAGISVGDMPKVVYSIVKEALAA